MNKRLQEKIRKSHLLAEELRKEGYNAEVDEKSGEITMHSLNKVWTHKEENP